MINNTTWTSYHDGCSEGDSYGESQSTAVALDTPAPATGDWATELPGLVPAWQVVHCCKYYDWKGQEPPVYAYLRNFKERVDLQQLREYDEDEGYKQEQQNRVR